MENLYLHELVSALHGEFLSGDPHAPVRSLTTDTRTMRRGDYFVALTGENFDGHDFLKAAVEKKAEGIIVSRTDIDLGNPFPAFPAIVRVRDTRTALGDLAAYYRKKWNIPVVCVTGSNGKTTTRQMLAAILNEKGTALAAEGNFNNQIGLPLTLLNLGPAHEYCVLEMGTSFPGEIRRLAEIASPTAGIITNIGSAHLENFGDRDGVFAEKRALLDALPADGFGVVNADDPYLSRLAGRSSPEIVTFGVEREATVTARDVRLWPDKPSFTLVAGKESARVRLPVYGRFNICNALAAAAAAWKLGFDLAAIIKGIEGFAAPGMRMEVRQLPSDITIINDAYNANPSSVRESVESLVATFTDREKVVVLGDMLELGSRAETEHADLGRFLSVQPIGKVFLFGPLMGKTFRVMEHSSVRHFTSRKELEEELRRALPQGAVVLFKGSRGMRLEETISNVFKDY